MPLPEAPLAERLFRVADGVYRIPLPTPYPVGDVNAYLVDGPRPVLIDTGVAGERAMDALALALCALGRRVEDVRDVLLTHIHQDHAGNADAIRLRAGATVRVAARAVPRLADIRGTSDREFPLLIAFLRRAGFGDHTIDTFVQSRHLVLAGSRSCPVSSPLADGEALDLGDGRRLSVHARPGHSRNDLLFLLDGTGVAFTGDHVLEHITPNPTLDPPEPDDPRPYRALVTYQESLRATAGLPVDVAAPGHGAPFGELAARCRTILAMQDRRIARTHRILAERGPMSLKDLSRAMFGPVRNWDVFLTLSEAIGAVQALEAQGRAERRPEDGVERVVAL